MNRMRGCPAPRGACSHPTICRVMGCAALEGRERQRRTEHGNTQEADAPREEYPDHGPTDPWQTSGPNG